MAGRTLLLLLLLLLVVAADAAFVVVPATAATPELVVRGRTTAAAWMRSTGAVVPFACLDGTAEECLAGDQYDESGSGGGGGRLRRRLFLDGDDDDVGGGGDYAAAAAQYISYAALLRDSVPCSLPGASYYNCRPGADANPYARGCSAITQCRD